MTLAHVLQDYATNENEQRIYLCSLDSISVLPAT